MPVFDADRGTARVVVAPGITGRSHQPGQHFMAGHVTQVRGQGAFHQLETVVEVVFQRPCGGVVKGDGRRDRFLAGIHPRLVSEDALTVFFIGDGFGLKRRASAEQHGRGEGGTNESAGFFRHVQSFAFFEFIRLEHFSYPDCPDASAGPQCATGH
ncbi:hypothetical protein D3C76_1390360 [compost metagenome]